MNHEIYMQRCLELAKNALREAMPNPSVGAVLVHEGIIIGEGHTSPYGGPHGEVNCINSVRKQDRHLIPSATLYVSLEPCSHFGKTPPCSDLIIRNGIKKIVIGTIDPHLEVAGNGIRKLEEAGCEVIVGVLEKECRHLNKRFFTFHEKKRPYVILKWAESTDGFLSPLRPINPAEWPQPQEDEVIQENIEDKKPVWITGPYSRQLVHKWRSEEMAILVGTQTVLDDNPQLDVRDWTGPNPVRIVLDRSGKISGSYYVKNQKIKTIVLTEKNDLPNLENLQYENAAFDEYLPSAILEVLYRHNLLSVIIEGGRRTLQTFIDAGLWDEARVFRGVAALTDGTPAPQMACLPVERKAVANDELLIFRNYDQHGYI